MNVLVTAGGTIEKIDAVRGISNMSTGRLGSLVASCFAAEDAVEKIFFICNKAAAKPVAEKIEIINVDSVSCLENAINNVFKQKTIDIIVHSMAVSDYRVNSVTSVAAVTDIILQNSDITNNINTQSANNAIASLIKNAKSVINGDEKINSDIDDMLLLMERTPKIISLFQKLSPQSILVGFKLLDSVPLEKLIDKGFQVLTQNKCSFVLANDLKDITDEQHIGYLIDRNKTYTQYLNKEDIAEAIASAAIRQCTKNY